jgi:leader peptidase (prepilin peptidase)/N-methyltransferase
VPSPFLFELLGFILGLHFGSFLNVCIVRLPEHESVVQPRSHCMACGHTVRWYDNLPVLSWLVLRGRCRDCGVGISSRYPVVELAVGVWFALAAGRLWAAWIVSNHAYGSAHRSIHEGMSNSPEVIGFAVVGFLLIGLMVMDWRTMRLPDAFTLPGIGIGFLLVCVQAFFLKPGEGDIVLNPVHQLRLSSPGSFQAQGNVFMTGTEALVLERVAAIAGAALLLLAVRWLYKAVRKRDGMGLGDVKLLAMIAAFLGFGQSLVALFVGVLVASLYGIALVVRGKAGAESKLPLGSFLAAGGLAAALFGNPIVDWYIRLLR